MVEFCFFFIRGSFYVRSFFNGFRNLLVARVLRVFFMVYLLLAYLMIF